MPERAELLPGTLELLILKAASLGRLHGYGVLLRIEQISGGALLIQQGGLLVAQAALSALLLVGAGLFVLSLQRVRSRDVGIDLDRVLLVQLPERMNVAEPQVVAARYRAALERVRRLPGVERATLAGGSAPGSTPGSVLLSMATVKFPGRAEPPPLPGGAPSESFIHPDYFATIGARLLRGRAFSEADGSAGTRVAIVNHLRARHYWPHANPIGQRLVALGLATGLAAALAAGRFLKPLLYQTSPRDPRVLAGVAATLLLTAIAAALVPGLRAARVDPMAALRAE